MSALPLAQTASPAYAGPPPAFVELMASAIEGGAGLSTASAAATILLVEDEVSVRSLLARVLRARGYNVTEAVNGDEALRLAREREQPFHLLLSDVMMPSIGGVELAARLRAEGLAPRVILMTGYADLPLDSAGADIVLRKPFGPAALTEAVRRALAADAPPQ